MNRRAFLLNNVPAAALASAAVMADPVSATPEAAARPYFEVMTFRLHFGAQNDRFLTWLEKRAAPLLEKNRLSPMGVFSVGVGPHVPAVITILSYPSLAEMEAALGRLLATEEWAAAVAELESAGPPYFRADSVLLRATSFSPPFKATPPEEPAHQIYELRFYEASTQRQLRFMHDRFSPGEIEIFHKCGIHPILYADTVIGPNMPNMAYLIPFASEAHREKAWAAFGAHPDWKKLAAEFMQRSGELARNISSTILVPTSFSSVR